MEEKEPLISYSGEAKPKNSAITTQIKVLLFVMINCIGLLVSGSVQTQYIYDYIKKHDFQNSSTSANVSLNVSSEQSRCQGNTDSNDDKQIQARSSDWVWYISTIEYGLALPVIFLVGPIVDKVGRKPVIMWNVSVMTVSFAIKALSVYFQQSLYIFMIGFAVEGLSGGFQMFHLANLAVLADTSSTGKDRTMMMALYDALLGVGSFLTYVGTGYLLQLEGFTYPFVISTGLFIILTLLIGLTFSESYTVSESEAKLQITDIHKLLFAIYEKKNIKCSRGYIISNLVIFFLCLLPMMTKTNLLQILTLGFPFCWTPEHIGWYSAISSLVTMVVGITILKLIHIMCKSLNDTVIVILGLLSSIAAFTMFGFSNKDYMIYEGTGFSVLQILPVPLIKAMLSRVVDAKKQGALFANIYLIEAINSLTAPLIFNNIFHMTVDIYRGIVFFVMAGFPFICILLTILVTCCSESIEVKHVINVDNNNVTKQPPKQDSAQRSDDPYIKHASIQSSSNG